MLACHLPHSTQTATSHRSVTRTRTRKLAPPPLDQASTAHLRLQGLPRLKSSRVNLAGATATLRPLVGSSSLEKRNRFEASLLPSPTRDAVPSRSPPDVGIDHFCRQEGYYDPDLLQSRPRNTAASAVPSTAVADAAQQRGGEASTDTSAVPYASRPGDDPAERIGSKSQRSSSGNPKTGVNGRSEKPKTSGYPSRPRGADDKGTHHRHGGRGRGDRGGGRTAPRRKRKQLAWWQKPRTFVALIALIIVVGAAVGLGVGLTAGKKGNERSPGNPASSPSGSGPTNSRSVIQPSVSEASTAVASATSTPLSPEPSVSIAPRSRIARDGPPKARSRWT